MNKSLLFNCTKPKTADRYWNGQPKPTEAKLVAVDHQNRDLGAQDGCWKGVWVGDRGLG